MRGIRARIGGGAICCWLRRGGMHALESGEQSPRFSGVGVLAVATALLGRTFGLHDVRFLASEVALLVSMFVISRYVLPLVERRDRGAAGEEHVGSLLEERS